MALDFDYFYGCEAEQFSFFRIPKRLFKDKKFRYMSTDAKLLYGLMLDRISDIRCVTVLNIKHYIASMNNITIAE